MSRVLVVEDESAIAELIALNLRHAGFEVTLAHDAVHAIAEVDRVLPDLVLLDLAMPKMSGAEVLRWIREQPGVRKTKVLIFTSSEKPEDFKTASEIGADGYLLKPTKFDDLKKLVKQIHEEWLDRKKGRATRKKADAAAETSAVPDTVPAAAMAPVA